MKKTILSIVLVMTMLVSLMSIPVAAEGTQISLYSGTPDLDFWGALYDDEGNPITKEVTIMTADQLMGFAEMTSVNAFDGWTIKLGADMVINTGDASEWSDSAKAPSHQWKGGSSYGYSFSGTFDGQGHVISGLYTVGSESKAAALFGYASRNATIQNVSVVNSYFGGVKYVSAVVGSYEPKMNDATLTIKNVHVQDTVVNASSQDSAGFVGYLGEHEKTNTSVKLEDVSFVGGSITVGRHSGGVVGRVYNGKTYENGVAMTMNRIVLDTDLKFASTNADGKAGSLIGNLNGFRSVNASNIFIGGTLEVTASNPSNTAALVGILSNSARNVSGNDRALLKVENVLIAQACKNVNSVWFNRSAAYNGTDSQSATDELTNIYYDSDVVKIDTTGATGCKAVMKNDEPATETGKSFATLKGTDAGFTGWTTVANDYPTPTALPEIDVDLYKNYVAPPAQGGEDEGGDGSQGGDDGNDQQGGTQNGGSDDGSQNNGSQNNGSGNNQNNDTQTQAPAESETTPTTTEKKSGCSSVVGTGFGLIALICLGGATIVTKKSKK